MQDFSERSEGAFASEYIAGHAILCSAKYTQKAKLISGRRGFRKNKNKARGISPTQKQNINRGISPTGFFTRGFRIFGPVGRDFAKEIEKK